MFRWAFKSRRFVDLGFETEAPLLLYQRRNIDYYSIATFILHCSSCGSITQAQLKEARKMLDEIDYLKDLGIGNSASNLMILKALNESEKFGRARKWMLRLILLESDAISVTNEDVLMLYKTFLYPKVASINNENIEKLKQVE